MEWIFEKYLKTLLLLWIRYGVRIVDYVWNPFFFLPRTFMEIKWPPNIFLGETCLEWFTFCQIHDIFRKRKLHRFGYILFYARYGSSCMIVWKSIVVSTCNNLFFLILGVSFCNFFNLKNLLLIYVLRILINERSKF